MRAHEAPPPIRTTQPLRAIEELAALSQDSIDRIGRASELHVLPKETVVFHASTRPVYLHAVLEGQVALGSAALGKSTVTEILGSGCLLGLAAFLGNEPYLTTATTLSSTTIVRIDASWLRAEMRADIELFDAIVAAMSRHDRMLTRQLTDLKLRSAGQRLGCYLLRLSKEQGGATTIRLPCTKSVLAAYLGMAPEHLSRAFATLQSCGIAMQGGVVNLNDVLALQSFSKPDKVSAGELRLSADFL